MTKTIKLKTERVKGFGFYFGWQDNTIIFLVPFILLEIKFVSDKIEAL